MKTPLLPSQFLESCSAQERKDVADWWADLDRTNQSEVAILLDHRGDSRAYVFDDASSAWQTIPIEHQHLESGDDPREFERERYNQWLQHVLDHPELTNNWDVTDFAVRTFHICVNHPAAVDARQRGLIYGDFVCPNNDGRCPISNFAKSISFGILLASEDDSTLTTWLCKRRERDITGR